MFCLSHYDCDPGVKLVLLSSLDGKIDVFFLINFVFGVNVGENKCESGLILIYF